MATLWNYDDVKMLAVHRFKSVEALDEHARKPKGFKLDKYLESGALGFPLAGEKTIKLKALFNKHAAAHLHESPLSLDQTISEQDDDDVLVEAEVLDTHQLRWCLLSFGEYVEVVSPKSLRKDFAEMTRNMASYYEE